MIKFIFMQKVNHTLSGGTIKDNYNHARELVSTVELEMEKRWKRTDASQSGDDRAYTLFNHS